jgi:non-homologous end joining protein Ku
MVRDPAQERLKEIVAATSKEEGRRAGNVVDIHDALRKSLTAEDRRTRKR